MDDEEEFFRQGMQDMGRRPGGSGAAAAAAPAPPRPSAQAPAGPTRVGSVVGGVVGGLTRSAAASRTGRETGGSSRGLLRGSGGSNQGQETGKKKFLSKFGRQGGKGEGGGGTGAIANLRDKIQNRVANRPITNAFKQQFNKAQRTGGGREQQQQQQQMQRGRGLIGAAKAAKKSATAAMTRSKSGRGPQMQEGEDSSSSSDDDDEIMSISSDEDEGGGGSIPAVYTQKPKPQLQKLAPRMTRLRLVHDDEEDGVVDEPEEWAQVHEDVLQRNVRDLLRAKRGVAVQGSLHSGGGPSRGSDGSALGAGVDLTFLTKPMDPLGMGPLDLPKRCLASRSALTLDHAEDEGQERAMAKVELELIVNVEDSFDPQTYLAVIHHDTPFHQLQTGRDGIIKQLQLEEKMLQQIVKDNFDSCISCKTSIADIERQVHSMHRDCTIAVLHEAITTASVLGQNAFGPLLERQAQVDRIRSVQNLLSRFRMMFNLPGVIRAMVKEHDYEGAVFEYLKAKSINLPGQSNILRRVQAEVEKVVDTFVDELYAQMNDPKADQTKVENAIRLLLLLDPTADPVWDYLTTWDARIRGLLEGCVAEHNAKMAAVRRQHRERREESERWKALQLVARQQRDRQKAAALAEGGSSDDDADQTITDLSSFLEEDVSNGDGAEEDSYADDFIDPELSLRLHATLVRRLSAVLKEHLPQFWRVSLAIFSGKFANFTAKHGSGRSAGGRYGAGASAGFWQVPTGPYKQRDQLEALALAMGIVGVYDRRVREAFLVLERSRDSTQHMRQSVAQVASVCSTFAANSAAAPVQAVEVLQELRVEVASRFVRQLCFIMRETAGKLAEQEDWVPAPAYKAMGSPFDISMFPVRFQDVMAACLGDVSEVLAQIGTERLPEREALVVEVRRMYDSVKTTFFESFMDVCESLGRLSEALAQEAAAAAAAAAEGLAEAEGGVGGNPATEAAGDEEEEEDEEVKDDGMHFTGLREGVAVRTQSQKLLMLLSNSGFVRCQAAPHLAHTFQHLWLEPGSGNTRGGVVSSAAAAAEASKLVADIERSFVDLETALGDQYIAVKAAHLGMAVVRYFLEDGTSWATAPPVKGLRDSALDLMLPLVAVHAEVNAGCSTFVERAINTLAEGLMDALHQVADQHEDLQSLDPNAFCQLSLELDYFQVVLQPFASQGLDDIIGQLRAMLLDRTMRCVHAGGGGGLGGDRTMSDEHRSSSRRMMAVGALRGEEAAGEERDVPTPHSHDHLRSIAESLSADLLPNELRRTRVNVLCFGGSSIQSYLNGAAAASAAGTDTGSNLTGDTFSDTSSVHSRSSATSNSSSSRVYSAVYNVPESGARGRPAGPGGGYPGAGYGGASPGAGAYERMVSERSRGGEGGGPSTHPRYPMVTVEKSGNVAAGGEGRPRAAWAGMAGVGAEGEPGGGMDAGPVPQRRGGAQLNRIPASNSRHR